MSRYIDADALIEAMGEEPYVWTDSAEEIAERNQWLTDMHIIESAPSIDIVRCENCRKSHIDGKTTHYLWCTEWGRSTDPFGYCERGEREVV